MNELVLFGQTTVHGWNLAHQFRLVVYLVMYRIFLISQVDVKDFSQQPYLVSSIPLFSEQNTSVSSWWFQPIWKILVKLGIISPGRGENYKYLKPPTRFSWKLPLKKQASKKPLSCWASSTPPGPTQWWHPPPRRRPYPPGRSGGWTSPTNPFGKYAQVVKLDSSSPRVRGEHKKLCKTHHLQ